MEKLKIKQLSVFMENRPGRLAEICSALGEAGINIRGFSVADMAQYGIFRLVVPEPEKAREVLTKSGFTVKESDVLCLDVPDRPGGLAGVLEIFSDSGVSVEYMYAIAYTKIVFGVENLDKAISALQAKGIKLLTKEEVAKL